MKISFISICFSVILFVACNQSSKPGNSDSKDVGTSLHEVQLKNENLESVLHNYLEVKDALVASDSTKVQVASSGLSDALSKIKGCENTAKLAHKVVASNGLEEQRRLFTLLTSDVIPLFKQAEIKSGSIFMQFCPMANNGDGGYWLAKEDQIRNPYYGDKMLKCGKVIEEFKPISN